MIGRVALLRRGAGRPAHAHAHPPAEALLLRDWALHLLGAAAGPTEAHWQAAVRCALPSWDRFLRVERCTLALQARLDARAAWDRLPAGVAALIRGRATAELKRVLSARAQIRTVARLAADHGWETIVLKGGVAVAAGALIDLGDVDILVDADRVQEVAAVLGGLGFEPLGLDSHAPHHLAARLAPNALQIEVHRSIKGGGGLEAFRAAALPLAGEPRLWRQGPVDHLCFLLHHSTAQHPERTGRIRDLLLIGHALRDASPEVIAEVERSLAGHEARGLLLGVLGTARALEGQAYAGDPFRREVLRTYVVTHRFGWLERGRGGLLVLTHAARIIVRGRRSWWRTFRQYHAQNLGGTSGRPAIAWLQRHCRPVGDAVRALLRTLVFGAATACALVSEGEARWVEARRSR